MKPLAYSHVLFNKINSLLVFALYNCLINLVVSIIRTKTVKSNKTFFVALICVWHQVQWYRGQVAVVDWLQFELGPWKNMNRFDCVLPYTIYVYTCMPVGDVITSWNVSSRRQWTDTWAVADIATDMLPEFKGHYIACCSWTDNNYLVALPWCSEKIVARK